MAASTWIPRDWSEAVVVAVSAALIAGGIAGFAHASTPTLAAAGDALDPSGSGAPHGPEQGLFASALRPATGRAVAELPPPTPSEITSLAGTVRPEQIPPGLAAPVSAQGGSHPGDVDALGQAVKTRASTGPGSVFSGGPTSAAVGSVSGPDPATAQDAPVESSVVTVLPPAWPTFTLPDPTPPTETAPASDPSPPVPEVDPPASDPVPTEPATQPAPSADPEAGQRISPATEPTLPPPPAEPSVHS